MNNLRKRLRRFLAPLKRKAHGEIGTAGTIAAIAGGIVMGGVAVALLNRRPIEMLKAGADAHSPVPSGDEIY